MKVEVVTLFRSCQFNRKSKEANKFQSDSWIHKIIIKIAAHPVEVRHEGGEGRGDGRGGLRDGGDGGERPQGGAPGRHVAPHLRQNRHHAHLTHQMLQL